ncbi:hypothetical protein RCH12_003412 [Cryobacterium sp. MP_3.1]|uniref:DUF6414 family protein n=1 Tax=Cryobacterium sp. MP_3.1 TaxID=3071711 RepID=UPI002E00E9B0|nr:hypothetical protein [Cryobacterium sp. MP_3.1]
MTKRVHDSSNSLIKSVYFDEESASDLLDVSAGGKTSATTEQVKERFADIHSKAEAGVAAKLSWFPFFGGSADVSAGVSASSLGRSILNKTLSNTILTDYLAKADDHDGVKRLTDLQVVARKDSAAFMKMFTPYMAMLRMDDLPINLAGLGDALEAAKGYYELVGEDPSGTKCILRFNIRAFRNSYGLADLGRMQLVFHGILVGRAYEASLTMAAEMAPGDDAPVNVRDVLDDPETKDDGRLEVYDVLLAGVEYAN